ncbi:hypothetical protein Moror_5236 [Moniliophthora roreri MCA 2997]|uniref:Uncharacterized protein n=1 Tax=Moniliophthora roreri (strain MCA 2997) TaxID=1381753 RepID=V2X8R6_MONRO|nr:hypothetical protein Moror_5236 [Moniliophthora roreri MCA 2997]
MHDKQPPPSIGRLTKETLTSFAKITIAYLTAARYASGGISLEHLVVFPFLISDTLPFSQTTFIRLC